MPRNRRQLRAPRRPPTLCGAVDGEDEAGEVGAVDAARAVLAEADEPFRGTVAVRCKSLISEDCSGPL